MAYKVGRYELSPSAVDLLMQLLQHDRHARPTIKEALKHSFNNDSYEVEKGSATQNLNPYVYMYIYIFTHIYIFLCKLHI